MTIKSKVTKPGSRFAPRRDNKNPVVGSVQLQSGEEKRGPGRPRTVKPPAPVVKQTYGIAACLWCRRPFEKATLTQKFDHPKCRMNHWHTTHRRSTPPGMITEVDGQAVEYPALNKELEDRIDAAVQKEVQRWKREHPKGA